MEGLICKKCNGQKTINVIDFSLWMNKPDAELEDLAEVQNCTRCNGSGMEPEVGPEDDEWVF